MAKISGEAALQLIQGMADHIQRSLTDLSRIQPPQLAHEQNIAQINTLLHQCFERLRERHASDTSNIKNEIVQYSGERKMMEMNGLRDAENACSSQVAAVLQALSDRLVATLPPSFFDQSRQNLATGALQPYLLGDLRQVPVRMESQRASGTACQEGSHLEFPSGSRHEMQQNTEKTESRSHQCHEQNEERAEPSREGLELDSTVPAEQRSTRPDAIFESTTSYYERAAHDEWNATQGKVFLKIIDADGFPRGVLKQVDSSGSRRVDSILKRPIRRPIQLRRGRRFSSEHLSAICKDGVKIVSCMIQASGEVTEKPCTFCKRMGQGPFDQCIIVSDNTSFRRCGNCEWVRGRCQGASTAAETQVTPATGTELAFESPEAASGPIALSLARKQYKSPAEDLRTTYSALTDDTLQGGTLANPIPPVTAEVAVSTVPDTQWRIHQIKTRGFTSAESTVQLWSWFGEEGSLKYLRLSKAGWKHLQCPVDFDIKLKDVAEVRASVESWRVRLVMKDSATYERQEAPRGDVMVVFEGRKAVQCFLQFCHDQDITVSKQEPPVMVNEWRDMEAEYTLAAED